MKKIIIFLALILLPNFTFATINTDLYFGMQNNASVKELQQFLISKNFLTGQVTGNYFSLTQNAVKKYQASKKIIATGSVGPLTRKAINDDLALAPTNTNQISSTSAASNTNVLFKGNLNVSVNHNYASQSVAPPQLSFKLADFSLKNNSNEDINLKNVELDLAIGSDLYLQNQYLNNLYLAYDTSKTAVLTNVTHINNFSINYTLPAGKTINLSFYADVNDYTVSGSVLKSSILVSGISTKTSTQVVTNLNKVFVGQSITFSSGTFTVEKNNTIISKAVVAGEKVDIASFSFIAKSDSYNISELKFVLTNPLVSKAISSANLIDNLTKETLNQKPVNVIFDGKNYILDFILNTQVSRNSTKTITVNYNFISPINSESTNLDITPILIYIKTTNSSGKNFDGVSSQYLGLNSSSYGGITLPASGVVANPVYAFRSMPTFSSSLGKSPLAIAGNVVELYKFSISADRNSDVAVKQLKFIVKINDPAILNPKLNYFKLFKENIDYTSSVAIGSIINENYIGLTTQNAIGIGIDNIVVITFTNEEVIPSGSTQNYILKANTITFGKNKKGTDSILTYMPKETELLVAGKRLAPLRNNLYFGLLKNQSDLLPAEYNILWSDRSSTFPNTHNNFNSMYTNDWYNGYNLVNLPLITQTITAK